MAFEHVGEIRSMLSQLEPAERMAVLTMSLCKEAVDAMRERAMLLETVGEAFDTLARMDTIKRRVNTP